jgi:hypothetical protein
MGYDRDDCWMTCGERDDKCAGLGISDPFADIDRLTRELAEARAERSESDFLLIARLQRELAETRAEIVRLTSYRDGAVANEERMRAALNQALRQWAMYADMHEREDGGAVATEQAAEGSEYRRLRALAEALVEQPAHDPRDDFSQANNPFPSVECTKCGKPVTFGECCTACGEPSDH